MDYYRVLFFINIQVKKTKTVIFKTNDTILSFKIYLYKYGGPSYSFLSTKN